MILKKYGRTPSRFETEYRKNPSIDFESLMDHIVINLSEKCGIPVKYLLEKYDTKWKTKSSNDILKDIHLGMKIVSNSRPTLSKTCDAFYDLGKCEDIRIDPPPPPPPPIRHIKEDIDFKKTYKRIKRWIKKEA